MKILFSIFLLVFAFLCPAAELGLETLPWTDACWFWTQDGPGLPQINRNLSGKGAISIGGVKFERGICGHTGFSVVYNLDKTAESFSAMIGIDEERHPKDTGDTGNVYFVVLTDRKEVFRRLIQLGEKPETVKIDLRGKTQLELRGEYGKTGFLLQRVAWGNPVIQTNTPEKLRAALENNRKKHEKNLTAVPDYPVAPEWKKIKIQKVSWNGFQNAYRIENGRIAATIVPEFGGRIVEFSAKGKTSLLKQAPVSGPWATARGRSGDNAGGHFMRVQGTKSFYPGDPQLEHGKFRIKFPAEGEIRMTSAESALYQVVYEYQIRISPDSDEMEVTNRLINAAPYERLLGVWSITRLDSQALKSVCVPPEQKTPPAKMAVAYKGDAVKLLSGDHQIEMQTNIKPKAPLRDFFELRAWTVKTEITADAKNGDRLHFVYSGSNEDASDLFPVHVYFCGRYTEIESHGPNRMLKPGESIFLMEKWSGK